MKKFNNFILGFIFLMGFYSCDNTLGFIRVDRTSTFILDVNATEAGETFEIPYTVSMQALRNMVSDKSTGIRVTDINLTKITFSIADSVNLKFEDMESAEVRGENGLIASLPPGITGKMASLLIPTSVLKDNFEHYYNDTTDVDLIFKGKARNSFPDGQLKSEIVFYIQGELGY
ncbi:MAG: hypothetical protein GC181_10215 [Bacteroidetes bacterium]|nr:hypothetical protein [Bacteroidota bacterium]